MGERPQVFAAAAVTHLHLVGYEQAARVAGGADDVREPRGRRRVDAVTGECGVDEGRGERVSALGEPGRCGGHVAAARVLGDSLDVGGVKARGPFLRREVRHRRRDAVVGVAGDDRAASPGGSGGDPPSDVVRLAARVHDHGAVEAGIGRHRREQPLREIGERLVQIARVRVQGARLAHHRLGDARVAVAENRHVVVGVEDPAPVGVDEPGPLAAHRVHRVVVGERGEHCSEHG